MAEHVVQRAEDKWRYTCPEGHSDWRVWNSAFGCRTCRQQRNSGRDVASVYEYLVDGVTGERVSREEIRIEHAPARTTPPEP